MKQIIMARPMRPFAAGDSYVLPDHLADALIQNGDAILAPPRIDLPVTPRPIVPGADPPTADRPYTTRRVRKVRR